MSTTKQTIQEQATGKLTGFDLPDAVREAAEAGIKQVKGTYDTCKALAEDATGAVEDSFTTMNRGIGTLQAKVLNHGKVNVAANFDFVAQMLTAKSFADVIEFQTRFARERFEAMTQQTRELHELAAKVQLDATKPFKDGVAKAAAQFQRPV